MSRLGRTDPQLIEYFDNFTVDEVLRHDNLDHRTGLMVQLAAMIACQAIGEYRVMLGAALTVGVTPVQVKEIVYQAVPYVWMAKVFDCLYVTNDVLTSTADKQHIQRWLLANCFGDHFTRGGIDIPTRELLTFTMLAALGGCGPVPRRPQLTVLIFEQCSTQRPLRGFMPTALRR